MWLFKLYLSKLHPDRPDLWQKPKTNIDDPHKHWFDNQVIGRDPLNNTMKNLSESAKLSTSYTNHCIRASTVTQLDTEGFEARHIMAISGHKSENSIKSYSSVCPDNKKRQMFEVLARNMNPKKQKTRDENVMYNQLQADTVPQEVNNLQNENLEIVPLFPEIEDDPLESDNILQMIDQIEKENAKLLSTSPKEDTVMTTPTKAVTTPSTSTVNNKTPNLNYNSVIQNVNRVPLMPHMFFPNSNVTINYNFKN